MAQIMETIPGGDGDLIELQAVRRPNRGVRFDLTHENQEDLEAQHYHEPKHTHTLQRNSWSSSTQKVLSSMPSRSIKWNKTAAVSQYQRRSAKSQRRTPGTLDICATDEDVFAEQEEYADELLKKLQGLSAGERVHLLREIPLSVSEKRQIRALVYSWESGQPLSADKALCCHQFQACFKKVLCGGWFGRLFQQKSLLLWQKVFKNISARFGNGVLSYFIFIKRLLLYNILLLLINGLFLLLPQISNPPPPSKEESKSDFWMLTGMGILTDSVMFYGHYSNSTGGNCAAQHTTCSGHYNITLAYIFTIGIGMFVTCVILVYSISKAIGKSFHTSRTTSKLSLKVFCLWDFKVYKKRSVRLQSINICTQLKETLSELICRKQKRNLCSTLRWLVVHLLIWSICLLCMAALMFAVNNFHLFKPRDMVHKDMDLLALPLALSVISHLLPAVFDMLSRAEHYSSPDVHIYVSIARNLLLKSCIFCALCYYWLWNIDDKHKPLSTQCWETLVGQELYRLIVTDLIFKVLYITLSEFLRGLCIRNFTLRRKKLEFSIAQEVLELIYSQTLVWFGVLFSPLLPAVQIGKLYVLFYFKKSSLMMNFQAPRKHWRASQMSALFIYILFFPSFTGALSFVIYLMWRNKPSSVCGPFRNFHNILPSAKETAKELGVSWLSPAYIHLVDNPLFLYILSGLFLAIIYFHMQVLDGQKMITVKLQEQINYEGEDKKFLITKIQALNELKAQQ